MHFYLKFKKIQENSAKFKKIQQNSAKLIGRIVVRIELVTSYTEDEIKQRKKYTEYAERGQETQKHLFTVTYADRDRLDWETISSSELKTLRLAR